MTDFDALVSATGLPDVYANGRALNYHSKTGTVTSIKGFIDTDYINSPGGYESNVSEPTTVISLQAADVVYISRGELLVDVAINNKAYEVTSRNSDESDALVTVVNVREIDQ